MMTDPISDLLARIRNAGTAKHAQARCPGSKLKVAVARVLEREGYLQQVRVEAEEGRPMLVMPLRYGEDGQPLIEGLRRVSRPSRRVYVGARQIPRVRNGLGIAVLSTSQGILTDRAAREACVGGEVLFEVW